MNAQRPIIRKAAQLVALAHDLSQGALGDTGDLPHPTHWPTLHAEEALREWDQLRCWVDLLRMRFPHLTHIPECWWRHNDLVEILAALRDYERACFSPIAPASAAVEWQRALQDMELRMEIWIKRFTCGVAGRGHQAAPTTVDEVPDGWADFIDYDIAQRRSVE
jgi:hypothetical protein